VGILAPRLALLPLLNGPGGLAHIVDGIPEFPEDARIEWAERISYSSLTRSAQVFFSWRFMPQKVSLGTKSSMATPNKRPSLLRRTPTTRACEVSCEERFVNSM